MERGVRRGEEKSVVMKTLDGVWCMYRRIKPLVGFYIPGGHGAYLIRRFRLFLVTGSFITKEELITMTSLFNNRVFVH